MAIGVILPSSDRPAPSGNAGMLENIRSIRACSGVTYGAPRVYAELRAAGVCRSHERVARLMRQNRLAGRHLPSVLGAPQ